MVVDLFDTLKMIEGWCKISKTPKSMKYQSHEVKHVAKDKYDTWPNQLLTIVKV
jgi:hypothetical protein